LEIVEGEFLIWAVEHGSDVNELRTAVSIGGAWHRPSFKGFVTFHTNHKAASSNMHLRKLLSPTRHEWGGRLYEW
jgi:hypothetical protein